MNLHFFSIFICVYTGAWIRIRMDLPILDPLDLDPPLIKFVDKDLGPPEVERILTPGIYHNEMWLESILSRWRTEGVRKWCHHKIVLMIVGILASSRPLHIIGLCYPEVAAPQLNNFYFFLSYFSYPSDRTPLTINFSLKTIKNLFHLYEFNLFNPEADIGLFFQPWYLGPGPVEGKTRVCSTASRKMKWTWNLVKTYQKELFRANDRTITSKSNFKPADLMH